MKLRMKALLCLSFIGLSMSAATANEERDAFVRSNVIAILYHELAHAVIDLMGIPIFGQEEDAADVMAVLMIDMIFEDDTARSIAYDSALGYLEDPEGNYDVAWWDTHGPDQQRYFNHVCLFYGAAPDSRDDLAEELGLPEERAESCPDEFDLAADSWGIVFDQMTGDAAGGLEYTDASDGVHDHIAELLEEEVAALNADFRLPEVVEVRFEPCGEPNAFYDLDEVTITFCTEFVDSLQDLYDSIAED